jgi:hemolysin D
MSVFTVFWDSWKNRHTLGNDNNTRELAAFLPAALEIQQAPPNPLAKWLGRSLIVLFTFAIIWAALGEVNIVASAEGKIIPSSRVKQIQPHDKAVVKAILVHEGQQVEKGQALIELDSTLTGADKNRLQNELHTAKLNLALNTALIKMLTLPEKQQYKLKEDSFAFEFDDSVTEQEKALYQQRLWQRWQQYRSQKQTLKNTLTKNKSEQATTQEVIKKFEQTLPIIQQRADSLNDLYKQGVVSEVEYLELKQMRIEQTQDLAAQRQQLKQLKAAATEVNEQLNTLVAQTKGDILTTLSELEQQTTSLHEELAKATDLDAKQVLYSPVSGQVQELAVNTVGGVVTAAQQLMLIVPDEQQLEVEVFLENNDIRFVHEGMDAEIKIHTFPFTKYGLIDGEVTTISDDATVDEQRGLIYGMHLLMKNNTINVKGKEVKLMPGMAVTAEVKTGTRRIIEFFLAPLLRYKNESIRER